MPEAIIGPASAPAAILPPESTSARRRGRISRFTLLPPLLFSCGGFYTGRGGTHLRHPAPRLGSARALDDNGENPVDPGTAVEVNMRRLIWLVIAALAGFAGGCADNKYSPFS